MLAAQKLEIISTIRQRQEYGGQEYETNTNYRNINVQKKHRFWILDSGYSMVVMDHWLI